MMISTTNPALSPALLLHRIAEELLRCQGLLGRVEQSVQVIMSAPSQGMIQSARRRELQDIDLLRQSLADLARCLRAISASPPLISAADLDSAFVLGEMHLEDLRHRLVGNQSISAEVERVELF